MAADARRYVRAERSPLRRHRLRQLPPGAQRIGLAVHRRALRGGAHAGWTPDGLFCQWLPLHQLDLETLRSIVRSFLTVVSRTAGRCSRATASRRRCSGWSGAPTAGRFDVERAARSPGARRAAARRVAGLGLEDELAVLGGFVAGPAALRRFAGDAPREHRRSSGGGVPRAADHLRARFAARATGCSRCCASCRSTLRRGADRRRRPDPAWRAPPGRLLDGARPLHRVGPRRAALAARAGHAGAGARAAALRAAHQPGLPPRVRSAAARWRRRWRAPTPPGARTLLTELTQTPAGARRGAAAARVDRRPVAH